MWIAVAFAAGIAVGVVLSRSGPRPAADPVADTENSRLQNSAANSGVPTGDALAQPKVPADLPPAPVLAHDDLPVPVLSTAAPAEEAAEYTGYSEPIDVGPVLGKSLTEAVPGVPNQLADAHRALEREMRDDSWSYPLEAELHNSMVADASAGKFTIEHVECRATACEIRLSGKSQQFEAISRWPESAQAQPWSQRVLLSMSSTIGNGDRVDRLIILKKPPRPAKAD